MKVFHEELLFRAAEPNGGMIKFLLNEQGLAFLPVTQQHRDLKFPGLSYEHDYQGNALAGVFQNGKAEIRYHQAFPDQRVKSLWRQAEAALPQLAALVLTVGYQGRPVK
jgi:hypothetical protein